jgi:glycosyltransferase involved in cell wall biosynthesis
MTDARATPELSVIVPVGGRVDDLAMLIGEYADAFDAARVSYEIIAVLDGRMDRVLDSLHGGRVTAERLRIIELSRAFGESAALMAGFDAARGEILVTLPAYYQVEPRAIPKLVAALSSDDDMLVAVRWPRAGTFLERLRRDAFHWLFAFVSRLKYRDLGCGVRIFTREVADEIPLYGDQHRFMPALAQRRGFRVREIELAQSPKDRFRGRYRLREYLHGFLDVLTVFFLVRFTKKPLRFFGTVGFLAAGFGGIFVAVLVVQRLFFGIPLADRPALLLGSLLVVLGVQVFALGLVGELIIFTHASDMKEYTIRSVIQASETGTDRDEEPRTLRQPGERIVR